MSILSTYPPRKHLLHSFHHTHIISTSPTTHPTATYPIPLLLIFTEKLLGSYENSGWIEQHSLPKPKPWKYYQKLPTSTGGPIIICLDTSWSMSGPRESLAKAVVLGRYRYLDSVFGLIVMYICTVEVYYI